MFEYNHYLRGLMLRNWQKRRAWWPVKSCVSGHWIWLKECYCNLVEYPVFGSDETPITVKKWMSPEDFIWLQLRGDL